MDSCNQELTKTITVCIPTIERVGLKDILASLNVQTRKPDQVLVMKGKYGVLPKIKEALFEAKGEIFVLVDDDEVIPDYLLETYEKTFERDFDKTALVTGSCLPLLNKNASSTELAISAIQSSKLAFFRMANRYRIPSSTVELKGETELVGTGAYNTKALRECFSEIYDRMPMPAWENAVFTWFHEHNYLTLYNAACSFYHKPRGTVKEFCKMIFRYGKGRANYFKLYPRELPRKLYFLLPSIFLLTLPVSAPLYFFYSPFYYRFDLKKTYLTFCTYMSYGAGFLSGIFGRRRKQAWS